MTVICIRTRSWRHALRFGVAAHHGLDFALLRLTKNTRRVSDCEEAEVKLFYPFSFVTKLTIMNDTTSVPAWKTKED